MGDLSKTKQVPANELESLKKRIRELEQAESDRKRAEEALRESNERLAMALEVGNAGVWEWYLKRDEVRFDDRFHAMLGYTRGELPSTLQEWLPYHHPEDVPVWMAKAEAYLRGDSPIYESEHRIRTKAGTWNWVFARGKFVNLPPTGPPEQCIGIAMNVTERKQAEEERKAHLRFLETLERVDRAIKPETDLEQLLWHIVKTVFEIFECDRAWLFYPCDPDAPSFRVPVEITRPEYPGAKVLNIDVPMSPDLAQNLREALASDGPVTYTAGTERPINKVTAEQFGVLSQMAVALYPKLGKPWVFGMHQCAHPRIWTEEEQKLFKEIGRRISDGLSSVLFLRELQENEERFRATFEQAAVGIAHVAPDGRWLRVNQKLCDIAGYSREELLRKTFQDITHPDDLEANREYIRQLLAGEIPTYSMEKRYIRKDGSIVWVNLTVAVVHQASGEPGHFISVIEDITERKKAEDEVRLNKARLESLLEISQHKTGSIQGLLDFALAEAIMLTGSKIGYIYFYDDQKQEFTLNTWSTGVMKECAIAEPQTIYHLENTAIFGETVRQARPIMVNDFQAPHPLQKGYPEGHAPLYKYLTIPVFNADRIVAVVAVANKQADYDESDIRQLTLMMDSVWMIADRTRAEEKLHHTLDSLKKAFSATVQVLVAAVETRDPYTAGHQNRSADLARAMATDMGLSRERIDGIHMAGIIHDIGKLSVPAEILSKPTQLTEIEFALVKEHANKGYEILKDVESPWPLAEIVYQHHERMDGSGYPRNLKGDDILMEARILGVADVVESMASDRPYRPSLGLNAALEEIANQKGTLYDADAVDVCLRLFREKGFQFEGIRL